MGKNKDKSEHFFNSLRMKNNLKKKNSRTKCITFSIV